VQEIISVVERRLRWSTEGRGAHSRRSIAAGRGGRFGSGQASGERQPVYRWRKQAREGAMPGVLVREDAPVGFVPVMIAAPTNDPAPPLTSKCKALVEIMLANDRSLKVDEAIEPAVLKRLLGAVDG
jgi:hypothetical protein